LGKEVIMDLKDIIAESLDKREREHKQARSKHQKAKEKESRRLRGLARARAWALEHFNANQPAEKNTLLDPPSFIVSFEGQEMTVEPQLSGVGMGVQVKYKYISSPMGQYWSGNDPLIGFPLPLLWVTGEFHT
jgi:hypothetical protein